MTLGLIWVDAHADMNTPATSGSGNVNALVVLRAMSREPESAEAFFADFYADKAFLGSGGVHAQAGLTDYHPPEVATRRTIIAHAAASYVLADSSKLGAIAEVNPTALFLAAGGLIAFTLETHRGDGVILGEGLRGIGDRFGRDDPHRLGVVGEHQLRRDVADGQRQRRWTSRFSYITS